MLRPETSPRLPSPPLSLAVIGTTPARLCFSMHCLHHSCPAYTWRLSYTSPLEIVRRGICFVPSHPFRSRTPSSPNALMWTDPTSILSPSGHLLLPQVASRLDSTLLLPRFGPNNAKSFISTPETNRGPPTLKLHELCSQEGNGCFWPHGRGFRLLPLYGDQAKV